MSITPHRHQGSSSTEKTDTDSVLPEAGTGEAFQLTEKKSPADIQQSEEDQMSREKARFLELRDGLAPWKWGLFHAVCFFGGAISGYDVSNVATLQVSIYHAFGRIDLLPWVVTSFSLGNAALSPTLDQIMKLIDLKWFTLGAWTLFLVATAVTGASPTIEGVIVGRTILGVAGGGCYLSLMTYITILSKPAEHARVNGLLSMGFAVGLICGPIIGGAFAENVHATWRWAFYIGIPYSAIVMIMLFLAVPRVRVRPQVDIGTGLRRIDWVGAFLHMSTLVLFDAACIFSGATLAWRSGVIALWVLSGVVAIIYAFQQSFSIFTTPARRILPIGVMSTRTGFLVMLCSCFSCAGYSVALYYLPLFYAFTRGDDSIEVAVHMLPYICVYIAAAIGAGIFLPIVRRYAVFYLVGGALILSGCAAMQSVHPDTPLKQTMGIGSIIGFGVGMTMQLGASVLALSLPANIRMDSSISMTLAIYFGTTVALAIAGCIFQNIGYEFLSKALSGSHFSSEEIRNALAGADSPIFSASNQKELMAAVGAVTSAIIRIFYIPVAAGALMVICSFLLKWEPLDFKKKKAQQEDEVLQAA